MSKAYISPRGQVFQVYSDEAPRLSSSSSSTTIHRASDVEPDERGQWLVTFRGWWNNGLYEGHTLGPFPSRKEALWAEQQFLEAKLPQVLDTIPSLRES